MPEAAISEYFYGDEAEQFIYFRIPRQLITDPRFKHLSTDAKLLYGMLLDRMSLSVKNGWYDEDGRVYIYYTVEEICGDMNCGRDKAMKMLADLDTKKGVGLIRRVRQGQGKPTKLYVKRFTTGAVPAQPAPPEPPPFTPFSGVDFSGVQKSSSPTSASRESRRAGVEKTDPNYTNQNQTDFSYEHKAEAAERNTAIFSDDPEALTKLKEKLEGLQVAQTRMKQINAYYRKHGTCQGFHGLSNEQAEKLDERVRNGYSWEKTPYPPFALSNNNQEIRRLQGRIKQLTEARELGYQGWEFEGGKVVANAENNRLQVFFDEIPSAELRQELKSRGFHWARSEGAWQRQLTDNAIYSASRITAIQPKDGTDPLKIQPKRKSKTGPTR